MHFSRRASQMRFRGILVVNIIGLTLVCVSCGCLYLSLPVYYMFLYHIQDRYAIYVWYFSCFLHIYCIYIYTHMYRPVLYMCAACFFKAHMFRTFFYILHNINAFLCIQELEHHVFLRQSLFFGTQTKFRNVDEVYHEKLTEVTDVGRWTLGGLPVGLTKDVCSKDSLGFFQEFVTPF